MDLWVCPACKATNNEHAKYCRECGNWLLSTSFPAKKIVKSDISSSYNNRPNKSVRTVSSSKFHGRLKVVYVFEFVILLFFGLLVWAGSNESSNNLAGFLFFSGLILLVSSIILGITFLLINSSIGSKKSIRNHFLLSLALMFTGFIMFGMDPVSSGTSAKVVSSSPTLDQYKVSSLQLGYRDLTRNADSIYKNKMVHFKGKVYHLVNGKQNSVMIDVTGAPISTYEEVIYINRADNTGTLLVGDTVDIYGVVEGTVPTTNALGTESIVPSIESHYITLVSE